MDILYAVDILGKQKKGSFMDKPLSIMPCLDMMNGRVVKGVNFVNIRDAGDPV